MYVINFQLLSSLCRRFQLVEIDECLSNKAFHLFLQTSLTIQVLIIMIIMMLLIRVMIIVVTIKMIYVEC